MVEVEAVIFDMDGVIVDSESRHERAILDILKEIGFGARHGLTISDFIGRSDSEIWRAFIARNQPQQTLEQLLEMKRMRTVEILSREQPVFGGVVDLINALASRYRLALASGSERAVVQAVLEFSGLRKYFPVIVTGSDIERGKPAPDIFLKTATLLGVGPGECCVIEDSKPGVTAALAAGMRVIAITNTHTAEELASATRIVSTYQEIEELLAPARRR